MGLTHVCRAARWEASSSQRTSTEMTGELVLKYRKGLTKRVQEEVASRRKGQQRSPGVAEEARDGLGVTVHKPVCH